MISFNLSNNIIIRKFEKHIAIVYKVRYNKDKIKKEIYLSVLTLQSDRSVYLKRYTVGDGQRKNPGSNVRHVGVPSWRTT